MKRTWIWAGAVVLAIGAGAGAAALALTGPRGGCSLACAGTPEVLSQSLRPAITREGYIAQVMAPFRQADRAGDGLDEGDLALIRRRAEAQRRAQRIASVLAYDLDADLRVTRAEIADASSNRRDVQGEDFQTESLMNQYDANHDGVIEIREIVAAPERSNAAFADYQTDRLSQLMTLGSGGRLSAVALERAAEKVFDRADSDHNGELSMEEYQAYRGGQPPPVPRPFPFRR